MIARLDRVPMHLLVTAVLTILVLVAAVLGFTGVLAFSGAGILASALVAVGVSVLGSWLFGRIARRPAHLPSSVITGLILALIAWPSVAITDLLGVAFIALLAAAAKVVLVWRGRLVVNPAAAALVIAGIVIPVLGLPITAEAWWVASTPLLPVILVGGALVLIRTRLVAPALTLALVGVALLTLSYAVALGDPLAAVQTAVAQSPVLFLAAFMFSEPITLPPLRAQRIAVGALVGALIALPSLLRLVDIDLAIGAVAFGPAAALVVGNLVSFTLGARRGTVLTLVGQERHGDVVDLRFTAAPPLAHRPGQWVELSLPHRADRAGQRRVFSIASAPGADEVRIGIRAAAPMSSFKQHLLALEPGARVPVTRQGGDFTPTDGPTLMIAAGIGVTPFISHLAAAGPAQDTVLILLLRAGQPVPFRAELAASGARVIVVSPERPALDEDWAFASGRLDAEGLRRLVPDVADRQVLVSGSTAGVASLARLARTAGARRVLTDAFSGY